MHGNFNFVLYFIIIGNNTLPLCKKEKLSLYFHLQISFTPHRVITIFWLVQVQSCTWQRQILQENIKSYKEKGSISREIWILDNIWMEHFELVEEEGSPRIGSSSYLPKSKINIILSVLKNVAIFLSLV